MIVTTGHYGTLTCLILKGSSFLSIPLLLMGANSICLVILLCAKTCFVILVNARLKVLPVRQLKHQLILGCFISPPPLIPMQLLNHLQLLANGKQILGSQSGKMAQKRILMAFFRELPLQLVKHIP